jgi:hypothetical protein
MRFAASAFYAALSLHKKIPLSFFDFSAKIILFSYPFNWNIFLYLSPPWWNECSNVIFFSHQGREKFNFVVSDLNLSVKWEIGGSSLRGSV